MATVSDFRSLAGGEKGKQSIRNPNGESKSFFGHRNQRECPHQIMFFFRSPPVTIVSRLLSFQNSPIRIPLYFFALNSSFKASTYSAPSLPLTLNVPKPFRYFVALRTPSPTSPHIPQGLVSKTDSAIGKPGREKKNITSLCSLTIN